MKTLQLRSGWFRCLRWVRQISFALVDQGLISASNFILGLLLARWLGAEQYGVYALSFAAYQLALACFQAVILEPMSVLGPTEYRERFPAYFQSLLRVHGLITLAVALFFAIVLIFCLVVTGFRSLSGCMFALTFTAPCLLFLWLLRSVAYVLSRVTLAASGSLVYSMISVSAIVLAHRWNLLSPAAVLLCIACASLLAGIFLFLSITWGWTRGNPMPVRTTWLEHWSFGRWELSKVGFDWLSENLAFALTGSLLGLAQVGQFKALTNLFLPLSHTLTALKRLFLPVLSRLLKRDGLRQTNSHVEYLLITYFLGTASYGLMLWLAGPQIIQKLYGGKFPEIIAYIPFMTVAMVFNVASQAYDMGLRAIRSPKSVFFTSIAAAAIAICANVPLTAHYGLAGAVLAGAIANLADFLMMRMVFRKRLSATDVLLKPKIATGTGMPQ